VIVIVYVCASHGSDAMTLAGYTMMMMMMMMSLRVHTSENVS